MIALNLDQDPNVNNVELRTMLLSVSIETNVTSTFTYNF